jgi:hypothetical protein
VAGTATGTVTGLADDAGRPVAYGYAQTVTEVPRERRGLRIPAWLGVAAFLAGISFLL